MQYELYHYGVPGMKWGIRRYQNKDGSLTPAGENRLRKYKDKELDKVSRKYQVDKLGKRRDKFEEEFIEKNDTASLNKLTKARYRHLKAQSMEFLEKSRVESMTYDDMKNELSESRNAKVRNFLSEVEGAILGEFTDLDVTKTNMRIGLDESIYVEYEARKNSGYRGL